MSGKTVQGSCEYMGKDVMRLYRKLILSVLITGMAAILPDAGYILRRRGKKIMLRKLLMPNFL